MTEILNLLAMIDYYSQNPTDFSDDVIRSARLRLVELEGGV